MGYAPDRRDLPSLMRGQECDSKSSQSFFAADKAHALDRRGLDTHRTGFNVQYARDPLAHGKHMRRYPGTFSYNGAVYIECAPSCLRHPVHNLSQQFRAVRPGPLCIVVGEKVTYIAQCCGTEQRICQGMQYHIAIGMGYDPMRVWNFHTAKHDVIALTETVGIEALPYARHRSTHSTVANRFTTRATGVI